MIFIPFLIMTRIIIITIIVSVDRATLRRFVTAVLGTPDPDVKQEYQVTFIVLGFGALVTICNKFCFQAVTY